MTQLLLPVIYLAFISLGLPDSLLGSAWPNLYPAFGVPVSYAGIVSMIISCGTIVSSLCSDRLTRALGTGKVTALSVAMTAAALFGFSAASAFWMLCLWAIPYGLGAGSVDAALNNYVALHYESRHMSWLHCMWGVGTIISPVLMSLALTGGQGWNGGYHIVALIQVGITAVLVLSLPFWKGRPAAASADGTPARPLTLPQILTIPGAREVMLCFFCYCGLETTAGLWASSYLTLSKGVPADTAAAFAGLFYLGITVGRGFCGFVTLRFNDKKAGINARNAVRNGLNHFFTELRPRSVKTGSIGENKLSVALGQNAHNFGSRRLRLVRNNGNFLTEQTVKNRRFSDIRAADNGNKCGFCHQLSSE